MLVTPGGSDSRVLSIENIDHARPRIFREVSRENLGTNSPAARSGDCVSPDNAQRQPRRAPNRGGAVYLINHSSVRP